jgi:hypothetical protein
MFQGAFLMKYPVRYFVSIALIFTLVLTSCNSLSTARLQSPSDSAAILAKYEDALAKYNRIKPNMGYDEVARIMGRPGELLTGTDDSGHSRPPNYYRWVIDPDSRNIDVLFAVTGGGILNSNFVFDFLYVLPGTTAKTTAAKFSQVKVGMTYDQVLSILGSPGLLTESSLFNTSIYTTKAEFYGWWPENKPEYSLGVIQMRIILDDGLVQSIYSP